jgi:hypothetical protein
LAKLDGLLGLIPGKSSRLARAREQGFDVDTVYYHGTDADIESFEVPATGIFASGSPDVASSYVGNMREFGNPSAPVVYPVFIRKEGFARVSPSTPGQLYGDLKLDGMTIDGQDARSFLQLGADRDITSTDELTSLLSEDYPGVIIEGIVDVGPNVKSGTLRNRMDYLAGQGYPANPTHNPIMTLDEELQSLADKSLYANVPDDLRKQSREAAAAKLFAPTDVVVAFDDTAIRSINAKFDPKKSASEDILASGPPLLAGFLGAAALATPEEAEAGIVTASLSPVLRASMDKVLRGEEVSKRELNSVNKYLGQIAADRTAFGRRERMRMTPGASPDVDVMSRDIITPESMQGEMLVPIQGDASIAGGILDNVEGVPLDQEIYLQGGPNYPLMNSYGNNLLGWASMRDAAQTKQNQITRAGLLGDDVRGVYARMGDLAMDFNTMVAEAMVRQLPALQLPKKELAKFNRVIRKSVPDFAGVETPEGLAQLKGQMAVSASNGDAMSSNDLRKLVVGEMKKKEYGNKGFPDYEDTVRALTEPELRGLERGDSGFSTIKAMPGAPLLDNAYHDTYSHGIPGIYAGGLEESVPLQVMFPDLFRATGDKVITKESSKRFGEPLNAQERVGAVLMGGDAQKADQQWLDGVMKYLEDKKKMGRAAAIAAATSSGNAMAIPPEDIDIQNEIDARRAGGRKYRRDNPPSGLLAAEAQSQVLPRAAEAGQGFVSGLLSGIDTFVQGMAAPDPRAAIASPQGYVQQMDSFIQNQQLPPTQNPNSMMSTPAMRGLLDQQYMEDPAERAAFRAPFEAFGGLLAPGI